MNGRGGKALPTLVAPRRPESLPNKPLPALIMFARHVGGSLKEQREAWTKLGEGQEEWVTKAKEAEESYQKDLVAFNNTAEGKKYKRELLHFETKHKMQSAKKRFLGGDSAPKEPKKPASAYFVFVQDKRAGVAASMEKASIGDVAKKLTQLWQSLEPEEKKEYEEKAAALKAAYDEQLAVYRSSPGFKSYQNAVSNISGAKAKKAAAKAKAKAKAVAAKAAASKAKGRATADSDSDSDDVMGSDSDSDDNSSSNDSD